MNDILDARKNLLYFINILMDQTNKYAHKCAREERYAHRDLLLALRAKVDALDEEIIQVCTFLDGVNAEEANSDFGRIYGNAELNPPLVQIDMKEYDDETVYPIDLDEMCSAMWHAEEVSSTVL